MVAMPYLLLGVFGMLVYRGMKQKGLAQHQAAPAADGPGDEPCPPPSTAGASLPAP
jgi:hypothetical protein